MLHPEIPRLRMFAGPNGSGKSTVKKALEERFGKGFFGEYVNPDELESSLKRTGKFCPADYSIDVDMPQLLRFLGSSTLLKRANLNSLKGVVAEADCLWFRETSANSYFASAIAAYLHDQFLKGGVSFSLETVMSHESKVELLESAKELGFRTYLYYVATVDPLINVNRVAIRVSQGGHPVPEDKIKERYYNSLELLLPAIRASYRAYIFDNSTDQGDRVWLAEKDENGDLILHASSMPNWFEKYVRDPLREQ